MGDWSKTFEITQSIFEQNASCVAMLAYPPASSTSIRADFPSELRVTVVKWAVVFGVQRTGGAVCGDAGVSRGDEDVAGALAILGGGGGGRDQQRSKRWAFTK